MAGNSVNVRFQVDGGDLQSYIDNINRRAKDLSREMLRNAEKESDVAKEQLKSYNAQIGALQRKLESEVRLKEIAAEFNRDQNLNRHNDNIQQRYSDLDDRYQRGELTKKQYRQGVAAIDEEDKEGVHLADERYRQEIQATREQRRDNALLLRAMRDNVETVRSTSQQELNQMRKGDESLVNAIQDDEDPAALLSNRLSSQQYIEEQAKANEKEKKEGGGNGTFGAILKALAFDRVGGMLASMPNAKNELDYVKPMMAAVGMALGGTLGSVIDAVTGTQIMGFGIGQTNLGPIMSQIGEKIGEFFGAAFERTYKSREELMGANYRLQALTGKNLGIDAFGPGELGSTGLARVTADLSKYGSDYKQTAELQYRIATAQATGKNLNGGAENALALQQGLGITQDTFLQLTETLRSSKDTNRDVMKLVGGIASAGRGNIFSQDRTFLNEFVQKNFTSMQKLLLATQNDVASGTTFDILKRFNGLGGPWEARDSRSMGLISTIQNSLVNPGSDNTKALSFMALRQQNPGMNFYQLLEEQQKGLASPAYLKSMLGMVDRLGGDESMKMYNTANLLGLQGNLAAARKLYQNREGLMNGTISAAELMGTGQYSESSIRALGQSQTGGYTVSTAEIENAFIRGATEGVTMVADKMGQLFGDMAEQVKEYVDKKMKELGMGQVKTSSPKVNKTQKAMIRGAFNSKGEAQVDRTTMIGKI